MEHSGSSTFYHYSGYDSLDSSIEDDQLYGAFHPNRSRTNCSSADHVDFVNVVDERVKTSLVSEIDRSMKEQLGNILHLVDGSSARLSQLESKTRQLENSVDNLKVCAEYIYGRTNGKLRQLEITLREVQDDIHFIRNKQEISETKLHLAKLQSSNIAKSSEYNRPALPVNGILQPQNTPAPVLNSPIPLYQSYIPPKQFLATSQYFERPQQPQVHPPLGTDNFQNQPRWAYYPEQTPYITPPPSPRINGLPIQQFYGHTKQFTKPEHEFSFESGSTKFVYNSPTPKPSQFVGGYNNYKQVQKAETLPQALPTASFMESGISSGGVERKGSFDDVVDNVAAMGFRRDIVRATAKKLMDNGQEVDLNLVLDKLTPGDL